jgi:hypothetical protein
MDKKTLTKVLITIVFSYIVLTAVFSQIGSLYSRLFLPIFQFELALFLPELKVDSVALKNYRGEKVIRVTGRATRYVETEGKISRVDYELDSKVPVVNQYLHPVIIFSVLLAWPGITLRERFWAFLTALPFLVLVEALDIPLVIISQCLGKLKEASPDLSPDHAFPIYWANLLNVGGRYALSILAACMALASLRICQILTMPMPSPKDLCPCGSGKQYRRCCMR